MEKQRQIGVTALIFFLVWSINVKGADPKELSCLGTILSQTDAGKLALYLIQLAEREPSEDSEGDLEKLEDIARGLNLTGEQLEAGAVKLALQLMALNQSKPDPEKRKGPKRRVTLEVPDAAIAMHRTIQEFAKRKNTAGTGTVTFTVASSVLERLGATAAATIEFQRPDPEEFINPASLSLGLVKGSTLVLISGLKKWENQFSDEPSPVLPYLENAEKEPVNGVDIKIKYPFGLSSTIAQMCSKLNVTRPVLFRALLTLAADVLEGSVDKPLFR